MMRMFMLATAVALASFVSVQARDGSPKSTDEKFAMGALVGGDTEVKAARLALERSSDANVKKFAQKMIDDHTKCSEELKKILASGKMSTTVPQCPVAAAMLQKLSTLKGADFDECYMGMALQCHEGAVMCFRKEAKKGENSELRAFAEKSLPKLKEHLKMVRAACENSIERGTYETAMNDSRNND